MKKQSESRIVKLISSILNVRAWFDWERVRSFTLYLSNGFKRLFVPQQNKEVESFEEAATKLNLNDTTLMTKQKALFRLSIVMLIAAGLILGYAGYQLFYGSFMAVLVSLIVTLIALALAFRYHFWYYQIKSRKLGCTFDEWFRQGLLGEKK
ncbi:type IVB secretion system protein IcmV [Legionella rowbothamii]|uniref:type IVB secretion system protein IcmV n=1 Tax=Legionella rowbothamii TaxID=96229 RepID=UPI001055FAE3|nr:type IVB secretion system protein IcmV [Legionella rowbothamii]